ncbi:MAG: tail fiber protein [Candidatus Eremiobacteraeota bacterium]|nr:tail fiber protein [Candidatus Eremiobacteraeota bacterium]
MSSPYIGEIRMFGGNFAPAGWATCSGQSMPISENDTLFNLIGTTYGGDGQQTFNLPNLAGRAPVHMGTARSGTTYTIGETAGVTSVTLTAQQIPNHTHALIADNNAANTNQTNPTNNFYGSPAATQIYAPAGSSVNPMMVLSTVGGSQPHDNVQPYLAVTFIISLYGIYPSQT